jgi:8-oxo-dGTP diphosphatase
MKATFVVTAGIVRQEGKILLVQQQGEGDSASTWALPGGVLENGELLHQALARELAEETGIAITKTGRVAYTTQIERIDGGRTLALVFEVEQWTQLSMPNDPDKVVMQAQFVQLEEAINRLAQLPWRSMSEPAITYLEEKIHYGSLWVYAEQRDGSETFLWKND